MKKFITIFTFCLAAFALNTFAQNPDFEYNANCFQVNTKYDKTNDVVSVSNNRGASAAMSIQLTNSVNVYSIYFELELPRGVVYADKYKFGDRIPHQNTDTNAGNNYWFLKYGSTYNNYLMTGNYNIGHEGEIVQLIFTVEKGMPSGKYPIRIKEFNMYSNPKCTDEHILADKVVYLEIKNSSNSCFLGNAHNVDAVLTKEDPLDAADMILGKKAMVKEADVNWDANCTIGDLVQIIEMTKNQK